MMEIGTHLAEWWKLKLRTYIYHLLNITFFPGGAVVKKLPAKAGDTRDAGSVLGLRIFPRIGNGNPLQYSCLGNPMNREKPNRL